MSRQRNTEKFKVEAIKQMTERGRPVADVLDAEAVRHRSLRGAGAIWLAARGSARHF